ncbi:hypothetical protein BHE74_00002184 [Ensete ventricosum]|uniref:Uncharacterized protein n=1 Tax=Ensete ventricosum TaxID=4639 RepID=A0A426XIP4_ENSVE|nr:hypothetical protein B296_00057879 [Ensete ventricosum]RWW28657.1 hypothetical protein GW17_00006845 [Ensete ventricosum]RWW88918.1 hypothetical protein BHE74_00002184 [Ensete ventricosum]RZR76043.1 hypothetical protein BHM03_00000647 [Ensete ventricosum]
MGEIRCNQHQNCRPDTRPNNGSKSKLQNGDPEEGIGGEDDRDEHEVVGGKALLSSSKTSRPNLPNPRYHPRQISLSFPWRTHPGTNVREEREVRRRD